ncbi:MAG: hypothetical protein ABEJ66_02115, partial [Candidatus Nanohaloarchaea archaeon]
WYGEWPVVFQREKMVVDLGKTRSVSFSIINIQPRSQEYRVSLSQNRIAKFAQFASHDGTSFVTTVPGQGRKSFRLEVYGGNEEIDFGGGDDLRVQATQVDGDISGEDSVDIDVRNITSTGGGSRNTARNVPGIGLLQLLVLSMVSTLFVFTQS